MIVDIFLKITSLVYVMLETWSLMVVILSKVIRVLAVCTCLYLRYSTQFFLFLNPSSVGESSLLARTQNYNRSSRNVT